MTEQLRARRGTQTVTANNLDPNRCAEIVVLCDQAEMQYLRHASKDLEEKQLEAEHAIGKVETEERDEFLLYDQISRLRLAEEEAASISLSTCTNCSNTLLADSEFCRLCGTKRSISVSETSSVRPLSVDDITQLRIADEQALGVHSAQQRLVAHQRALLVTKHTDGSTAETGECEISEREQQQVEAQGSPICVNDIKESLKVRRTEERKMMLGASDKEPHENWWPRSFQFTSSSCKTDIRMSFDYVLCNRYLISSNWLKDGRSLRRRFATGIRQEQSQTRSCLWRA